MSKLRVSGLFASVLILLASSFVALLPQKAFAANETYEWTSNLTVVASGGDLQGSTVFGANGPTVPTLFGTMTYKTGCQFKVQMFVTAGNSSARLTLPTSAGSGGGNGISNPCPVDIAQSYNNQTVPLQGTRPGPGDAPETQLQKHVSVTISSPTAAAQSPASLTFIWKNSSGQTVATTSSPQRADTAGNSNDPNKQVVRYETGADLEPGSYSVCPSAIVGCQNFTKVKYQQLTLSYGESLSARNINVLLELSVSYTDSDPFSVGPVELSLQDAAGTGPVTKTQTNNYSRQGVPNSTVSVQSTISLRAVFENVNAGNYKVCVVATNTCQTVTKDTNRDADITISLSGAQAQQLTSAGTATPKTCAQEAKGLGWLACPLILSMNEAAQKLTGFIVGLLALNTDQMFTDPDTSPAYKAAWAGFRNIAYALVLIIGLAIVASTVLNIEIVNPITLRKAAPGAVAATVFATFSWEGVEFVYNFSNDAAYALADIIRAPFMGVDSVAGVIEGNFLQDVFAGAAVTLLTALGIAGVAIYAALGGVTVILALIASFALSLFSIFVLLEARNVAAVLLLVLSAIAIICAGFEPLKKVFVFWRGLIIVVVITVPGVAVIMTFASVGSLVAAAPGGPLDLLTALIILIAGIVMVWTLFLQMDKITGFLGNVASKVTGKAQQALSGYRSNTLKRRTGEVLSGQREMGALGKTMRYASLAGQPGIGLNAKSFLTSKGRAEAMSKLQIAEAAVLGKTSHDLLKNEDGSVSGNDDAMAVITRGVKDGADYEAKYIARKKAIFERDKALGRTEGEWDAQRQHDAEHEALETRQEIETRMKSGIETRATRLAAAHARWGSVSAYNDWDLSSKEGRRGMRAEMAEEIGGMMDSDLMSMTEVAATLKKNTQRTDISGHSFPQIMFQAQEIAKRYKDRKAGKAIKGRKMDESGGVVNGSDGRAVQVELYRDRADQQALMSDDEMEAWDRRSIEYVNAGQDIGQRTEAVKVHGAVARDRVQTEFQKTNQELEVARLQARDAQQQVDDLRPQLEAALAEEKRALSGAFEDGTPAATIEQTQRGAQERVRTLTQQMADQQKRQSDYQTAADRMQVEFVRQMATIMGKQSVMGSYASPENQRVFYETVLSAPIDPRNPNGPTIMDMGEQLRESSETFRNFERSYTQRATAGAQAALAQQTAAGAQAGAGVGMPPPGL